MILTHYVRFDDRYIWMGDQMFHTSSFSIKFHQICTVIFVFVTDHSQFFMFFQHFFVFFAITIWAMNTMRNGRFSAYSAKMPWAIPCPTWRQFFSSQATQMINFGTCFPITHQDFSIFETPGNKKKPIIIGHKFHEKKITRRNIIRNYNWCQLGTYIYKEKINRKMVY